MQRALLIAEKPSVKNNVEKAYQAHASEFPFQLDCLAMSGHLVRQKEPKEIDEKMSKWSFDNLPFNPDNYNGFELVPISNPNSKKKYDAIKQALASGKYDFIIHAGDPDQEGELLVRLLLSKLKNKLPVKRFWNNASTEKEYIEGLKNLKDDDHDPMLVNLYHAGLMRMQADYLLGMNGSIAAGVQFGLVGASVGRAVSAILNMIVTREEEILNFVPKTEYGVSVTYGPVQFEGKYYHTVHDVDDNGKEVIREEYVYFADEKDAKDIAAHIGTDATIRKVISQKKSIKAPKLYSLGDLQVDAAGKYGYASDETLAIVQSLYDNQYLTYPRTDCNHISADVNLKPLLKTAEIIQGGNIVSTITDADIARVHNDKTYVNSEECAKHGHTAILITENKPDLSTLTQEQVNIYTLVAKRFISVFLPPMIQVNSTIYATSGEYGFKSVGKRILSKGFAEFIGYNGKDSILPDVKEGDTVSIVSKQTTQKTSVCPKRFTKATIVTALNNPAPFLKNKKYKELKDRLRIGTPATQSELVNKLITKQYIEVRKNTYYPTELGMSFARALRVSDIVDVDTTAMWEVKLGDIRHGQMNYLDFKKEILTAVDKMIADIKGNLSVSLGKGGSGSQVIAICPHCGGKIHEGQKSFFCENYKGGCKFTMFKDSKIFKLSASDAEKLCKGEHVTKDIDYNGKKWRQELYYDTEKAKVEFYRPQTEEVNAMCPVCSKPLNNTAYKLECDCGFSLSRKIAEYTLTKDDINDLLSKGRTKKITKFYSQKKKKNFSAFLVLKDGEVKFEF